MRIGDMICLPPEPPVGAVLLTRDNGDEFRIHRDTKGWRIEGGTGQPISWRTAFVAWGPGQDPTCTFEIVWLPQDRERVDDEH